MIKKQVSLSTGVDFAVVPSADRTNVVYRDLYGCHGGYFEALFTFVVGVVSLSRKVCALGLQKKHSYVIPSMVRRVRMVAETVLGRKCEPISTRVERRSLLTCLPCAYIIHGNVAKSKSA